ncbi:extracellular solute-binding protein [Cohnella hashimotonis]|uniref:Extracellular solute-binding protein n=1 Tax=Cohnella hashimotonis TaxID=2826895 RepID=A0ABT6TC24_9BACL|nr:extracellular solute-binding protein [Cohnella hashimotonis]MDI4643494.1 extracellular solute-binding protein [Cohnella hashimotonis]
MGLKRKLYSPAAAALSLALALGACSNAANDSSSASGSPASASSGSEAVSFSMLYNDNPSYPFNQNWPVLKEIEARAKVHLDIQAVPNSDYLSKARIVLSSGTIPDLVTTIDQQTLMEYAPSGVLLPISDYMDKLPHLKQKIEEYGIEDELDNWKPRDGKLYILPFMNEAALYNRAPLIRTDLIDKYGLAAPTNVDELYTVLKTFKEKEGSGYPLANTDANSLLGIFGAAWGIEPSYNGFMFNEETGKFEYAYASDRFKAYLTYLNRLVSEGLADPEIFTSSLDQWKQKLASGQSSFSFYWISELGQLNEDGKKNVSPDFQLSPLPPIAGPAGKLAYAANRIYHGTVIPASAAKEPYFDKLLAFVDWLYSDEGNELMTWGIEGDTFTKKDDGNAFTEKATGSASLQKTLWDIGASNNNYTMLFPYKWFVQVLGAKEIETLTQQAQDGGWFPQVAKVPKLAPEKKEEENLALTSVKDYFAKMQEQFVYGKASLDTQWDSYVEEIGAKGVDKLLALYNDSLK